MYICSNCGAQSYKWSGRCLECGKWGSLSQEDVADVRKGDAQSAVKPAEMIDLSDIKKEQLGRWSAGKEEIDRVLGGGIVPGSLVLMGGEPGAGKSTILAQIADEVAKNKRVIYVSGEESASQVKARMDRLGCDPAGIKFVGEVNVEKIIASVKGEEPSLVIIDSIQTVYSLDSASEPGGVNQIRTCALKFLEQAKELDISFFLVGHITKDGQVAGPKTLEHMVDTVIYLEGAANHNYSVLRAVKNRFGSVNELGILEMTSAGFKEVPNPASVFMDESVEDISGSVISCTIEGTRPFLIDIQALVSRTIFGYPQRKAFGVDLNRLQILSSVISKKTKANLHDQDVVVNIIGGMKVNDTALDLPICLAIISSLLNQKVDKKTVVIGEVGLGGEVRMVPKLEERIKEAKKMGFERAAIPKANIKTKGIEIDSIGNIKEITSTLFRS